jgi:hypothetical protein
MAIDILACRATSPHVPPSIERRRDAKIDRERMRNRGNSNPVA